MNHNLKNKPLVEGAILTSIIIVLMAISNVPVFLHIGLILVEIPVSILYLKHRFKISLLAIIAGTIITTILFGIESGVTSFSFALFVGAPLGVGIKKNQKNIIVLINMTIGVIISLVLIFLAKLYITIGMNSHIILEKLFDLKWWVLALVFVHAILAAIIILVIAKLVLKKLGFLKNK